MVKNFIILNTSICENIKILKEYNNIYLIEDPYFFNKNFHKQKLVFYRASLLFYYDYLKDKLNKSNVLNVSNIVSIKYIQFNEANNFIKKIKKNKNIEYSMYDPIDIPLQNKYDFCNFYDSPLFLETNDDLDEYVKNLKNKNSFSQIDFYKWNRFRLDILMDEKNNTKPLYNKWSFDVLNRNRFDNNYQELKIKTYTNYYLEDAVKYVLFYFKNSFGDIYNNGDNDDGDNDDSDNDGDDDYDAKNIKFYYPVTFKDAKNHYNSFIKQKLFNFGKYQDSISKNVIYGNHSNISVLLNTGLLDIDYVINQILIFFDDLSTKDKKQYIASVEGFIRQIIGWRSYMRFLYKYKYYEMENENYFNFKNKITKNWYDGTTNINILDHMIEKVKKYAYLHHIERLMIVGNLSLLLNINPQEVYDWFMNCFIDANSKWIMYGNVYAMSQHSISSFKAMKRVYICSDNYLKKMSDFKNIEYIKDLYYKFLKKNKNKLQHDYILRIHLSKL